MKTESKPQKYLRLYRWLRNNGYSVKAARVSAKMQAGYYLGGNKHWNRYWKYQ